MATQHGRLLIDRWRAAWRQRLAAHLLTGITRARAFIAHRHLHAMRHGRKELASVMTSTSQWEVPTPTIKCGHSLSVKARSPAGHTTRTDIVQYKIDVRSLHCRRLLFRMGTTRGGRPPACASRSQQRASLARCLYGPQGCRWPRATPSQSRRTARRSHICSMNACRRCHWPASSGYA